MPQRLGLGDGDAALDVADRRFELAHPRQRHAHGVVGVADHRRRLLAPSLVLRRRTGGRDQLLGLFERPPRPLDRTRRIAAAKGDTPHLFVQVGELDVLHLTVEQGEGGAMPGRSLLTLACGPLQRPHLAQHARLGRPVRRRLERAQDRLIVLQGLVAAPARP